jgi:hypothetical protein
MTTCTFTDNAGRRCIYGAGHRINVHTIDITAPAVTKKFEVNGRVGYVDMEVAAFLRYDVDGNLLAD